MTAGTFLQLLQERSRLDRSAAAGGAGAGAARAPLLVVGPHALQV